MPPTQEEATALNNVNVQPEVNTERLVAGASETTLPDLTREEFPTSNMNRASAVANETQSFIQSESENAKKLAERQQDLADIAPDGELGDLFRSTQKSFGVNGDTLGELKDIQLQLADIDTGSKLTETRIAGGAGQTIGQAQREITQEQRENAVRTSGLAARAAVIQGNINTARQLALDAVNVAYKDRELKNQNLTQQIDILQGQVDAETAQLLQQERDNREDDQATVKELKTNIANAMVSGASQEEIRQLNDPLLDDAQKLALAQSIVARGANEMRSLDIQSQQASINASRASAESSRLTSRAKTLELAQNGDRTAIKELGYDPSDIPLTREELAQNEDRYETIQSDIDTIDRALENTIGFKGATGTVQSPWLSNILANVGMMGAGGAAVGIMGGPVGSGVGALGGAAVGLGTGLLSGSSSNKAKGDFLGDIDFILRNKTFDKFSELKARGVSLSPISEKELAAIAAASSTLSPLANRDPVTDKLIGFSGSPEKIETELRKFQVAMRNLQAELSGDLLDASEYGEIENL